jgi:hydantoinase/carbamoylase family amidase
LTGTVPKLRDVVDPRRVVSQLRDLHRRTGGPDGARRVAWTATWTQARDWLDAILDDRPVERTIDAAGNRWITLPGRCDDALVLGSHLDSVPRGGWLDGALGVLAAVEVLHAAASLGTPPVTLRVVDWADEEGARFGYGMLGSSAASGTLDTSRARTLRDADGQALPDVLAQHGVLVDQMLDASRELETARGYLELHIEQGPVLEQRGVVLGAVTGTIGVRRFAVSIVGQQAHAGSTPLADRRDPLTAASRLVLAARRLAGEHAGLATVGRLTVSPGIPTAVAAFVELLVDLRHGELATLERLTAATRAEAETIAAEEHVTLTVTPLWQIDPIAFDPTLISIIEASARDAAGDAMRLPSGPLHDAAEVARAGVPTAMLFVRSIGGVSHAPEEDTTDDDLQLAVRALAAAAETSMAVIAANR